LTDGCEEVKLGQMCRGARVIGGDLLRGYEGGFTADRSKVWRRWCRKWWSSGGGIVTDSGVDSRTQVWRRGSGCIHNVTTPLGSWIWHRRSEIRRGRCGVRVFRASPVAGTRRRRKDWGRRNNCGTAFFWGWGDGERAVRENGLYELMRRG
jgi:hypothetical protein